MENEAGSPLEVEVIGAIQSKKTIAKNAQKKITHTPIMTKKI